MFLGTWLLLAAGGTITGMLAGLLGIGGGVILVPLLISIGYAPIKVVATSSLAIAMTAIAGSVQNWRMGCLDLKQVFCLGLPALLMAQLGVRIATQIPAHILLGLFGLFLFANIFLIDYRKRLATGHQNSDTASQSSPALASNYRAYPTDHNKNPEASSQNKRASELGYQTRSVVSGEGIGTGLQSAAVQATTIPNHPAANSSDSASIKRNTLASEIVVGIVAGLLTGILGVGGGIVMITLQMLLLGRHIKAAIQISLGVLAVVALSTCIVHAAAGNLLIAPGLILGGASMLGVQISTRFLPKLPDATIKLIFRVFLATMSVYVFWQTYQLFTTT